MVVVRAVGHDVLEFRPLDLEVIAHVGVVRLLPFVEHLGVGDD